MNPDSMICQVAELEQDLRDYEYRLRQIPRGSSNPDDLIDQRIFTGFIRDRRAALGRIRRQSAQLGLEEQAQQV